MNRMKAELFVRLDSEAIAELGYTVMVERWHRAVGPGSSGRIRKEYHRKFTEQQRRIISRYKARFYRWYLVSGPPQHCHIKATTLALLNEAINFFAGV